MNIAGGCSHLPEGMDTALFSCVVSELERKGLVHAAWTEGHEVEAARLTDYGKSYIQANPRLHNPIDWKWIITTIIAAVAAVGTIAVIFISCAKL